MLKKKKKKKHSSTSTLVIDHLPSRTTSNIIAGSHTLKRYRALITWSRTGNPPFANALWLAIWRGLRDRCGVKVIFLRWPLQRRHEWPRREKTQGKKEKLIKRRKEQEPRGEAALAKLHLFLICYFKTLSHVCFARDACVIG